MIWGCISAEGPKSCIVFDAGKVNGDTYRRDIVPVLQEIAQAHPDESLFRQAAIIMQDNASIHKARKTIALFERLGITLMDWPANSPDLNPIKNIWSLLKERVGRHFPTTRDQVVAAIQLEWSRLTIADVATVCQSMRARCKAVIDAEGGHTRW